MNVCLISAPTASQFESRSVGEADATRIIGELAPLGILSLAAVLEATGLHPDVVDLNRLYYTWLQHSDQTDGEFCHFAGANLAARKRDFFGFSTVCSSYPLTLRIAAEVKRLRPDSIVALGGPQASVVDMATLRAFQFIDLVVRGEAEQTILDLLDALGGNKSLARIPGLTFLRQGEIRRNPDASVIVDLDSLPFPAFHLFPDIGFCRHVPLEFGRGCPFACTFCSTNDFFRRRFRLKSPAHMIAEMRLVKQQYGIGSFELVHDMLTVDRKRVVAFCEALLESNEEFTWGCSARTDRIDEELIGLMARAGCRGIFFGIETGSSRMQTIIDKGLALNDSADRIRSCDNFKINTAVSLMAGFPEETLNDLRATAAFFVDSLRYDHADPQLSILAPLADTPIEKQHRDSLVLDDDAGDLSFRGWPQEPQDVAMIAGHPEIFSSFYSVPMPHVDRELLKELRDFLLTGMRAFRWLLVGLHQDSGDIVKVFEQWRQWRVTDGADSSGFDRIAYYAGGSFRSDFLRFVAQHYIATATAPLAIDTLLEYEAALISSYDETGRDPVFDDVSDDVSDDIEEMISPDSRLRVLPGVKIFELGADYLEVVRRLRERRPLEDMPDQPVKIAILRTATGQAEIRQLGSLSAELFELCERGLSVEEIAEEFRQEKIEIAGVTAENVCLAGLEILRQQRLIGLA
jgi:radical SAM superfamily enzyme YgiQ (UPF0313 family)